MRAGDSDPAQLMFLAVFITISTSARITQVSRESKRKEARDPRRER